MVTGLMSILRMFGGQVAPGNKLNLKKFENEKNRYL